MVERIEFAEIPAALVDATAVRLRQRSQPSRHTESL
jgi:hypothetical protein